jgi:Na+/H+-dicarboxylate symporter
MKGKSLTVSILIAMALGVLVGYFVHRTSSPETIQKFCI